MLLKDLFHPAFLSRVVSWLAFDVAIFMAHEDGDNTMEMATTKGNQETARARHVR